MASSERALGAVRRKEYTLGRLVDRLRREVYEQVDPSASPDRILRLTAAAHALRDAEEQRAAIQRQDPASGLLIDTQNVARRRGSETTGLDAKVYLKMAHLP